LKTEGGGGGGEYYQHLEKLALKCGVWGGKMEEGDPVPYNWTE